MCLLPWNLDAACLPALTLLPTQQCLHNPTPGWTAAPPSPSLHVGPWIWEPSLTLSAPHMALLIMWGIFSAPHEVENLPRQMLYSILIGKDTECLRVSRQRRHCHLRPSASLPPLPTATCPATSIRLSMPRTVQAKGQRTPQAKGPGTTGTDAT